MQWWENESCFQYLCLQDVWIDKNYIFWQQILFEFLHIKAFLSPLSHSYCPFWCLQGQICFMKLYSWLASLSDAEWLQKE